MDLAKKATAVRQRRDDAVKRADAADARTKEYEVRLRAKTDELVSLEERLRLTRELVRLTQRLSSTLDKAKQQEKKLRVLDERAEKGSARVEQLIRVCEGYETKYDETRKKMQELEAALSELCLG